MIKDIQILVIEDEKNLRENISEILTHYNFRVIAASTGEEGIKSAIQYVPDIIICDIMLPGIDGYDVLNKVKQIPELTSTAFIFLTAKSMRYDLRTGMDMGADDYLTKPFTKEELINSIKGRIKKLTNILKSKKENDVLVDALLEKMADLTKTERKILKKISEGYTTSEIAEKLFVSKKTIENHRMSISRKLNLSGPNSLIHFALQLRVRNLESF